jgi:glycosyltransferase involved in cell wall biosynthesis
LGEYLAMGKAIVSTPISNQLPEELVHGKNIHIVSNMDDLKNALELLLEDDNYRRKLEDGARAYFLKNVNPVRVIENIMEN